MNAVPGARFFQLSPTTREPPIRHSDKTKSRKRKKLRASGAAEPRRFGRAVDATYFESGPVVAPRDADAAPRVAGASDGQYVGVEKRRGCAGVRRCRYAIDATA